jgi:hypothetical protein
VPKTDFASVLEKEEVRIALTMATGLWMKHVAVVLLVLSCAGCVLRAANIDELSQPEPHKVPAPEWRSEFDRDVDKPRIASLGDTMFVVTRYFLRRQLLNIAPPYNLRPLPPADSWSITHTRGAYVLYTSPDYYDSAIGVVATREGRLPPNPHMLRVSGAKLGASYVVGTLARTDALFVRRQEYLEVWGVRYGGHRNGLTEFQIIDRVNPSVTQIVQSVSVADRDLAAGVMIKGVLVKVIGAEQHGAITYTLVDVEHARRTSQTPQLPAPPEEKRSSSTGTIQYTF